MAEEGGAPEPLPDKLPEPIEQASGIVETAKWLYRWIRRRWGRVAAVVAVCLLILLLIWWGWPDIRERPGIEPVVDWFGELTPIPRCDGKNFCVAVADLDKDTDDKWGSAITDAVENLQDVVSGNGSSEKGPPPNTGIEVIRIPRTISASGNRTRIAEEGAVGEAKSYLERSHADLIIWGSVVAVGDKSGPRIFWTTGGITERSSDLIEPTGLQLPAEFWTQLASMLQLVVVTQYTEVSSQEGRYVADKLALYIDKVRALIPETRGTGWTGDSRGQVKMLLGMSLGVYGEQVDDNAALMEAINYYRELVQEYPRERAPLYWAMTENNLGNALWLLGERESGTDDLERAVAAYRAALEVRMRAVVPLDWATTENNLGNALADLGERESGTDDLERAVAAYRAALEVRMRAVVPLDWATTENNLCVALRSLGEREPGTYDLQQSVAACSLALLELPRQHVPLKWALAQNNLGDALDGLGQRESDTGILLQAEAAFRLALLEQTPERDPVQWAMTENNLGDSLGNSGELSNDSKQICEALQAHSRAWQVLHKTAPHFALLVAANAVKDLRKIARQPLPPESGACMGDQVDVLKEMGIELIKK